MAKLATGEVSGEEVFPIALYFARRTYWCSYRDQWSTGASSPASMAVRWPAQRRPAISGRDEARGRAWELHRIRAVLERVKIGREVERRGGVHGAQLSGELGRYSGEGFLGKGGFPWLTKVNQREHGVCEVKTELLARRSGRRRAVVAGRANSGEARRGRWRRRARACSMAVLWLAEWRGKWGARRGRAGEGERVEWRGPPGCHP